MDGGEGRTFNANFTGKGVTLLQDRVKEKLRELMGDYSDDTLAEYVVVLLRNGRCKDEAAKELQVFLGDDNDAFVSWLWDHLSSNLHLYVQPKATTSNDEPKSTRSAGRGLPVRSLTSSVQVNCEPEAEAQKTTIAHQKRDWGRIIREQSEAVPLRSVVANVSHAEEKDFHESHAEERDSHKSHAGRRTRSPDMHNHRKRSREADSRSTKRVSNPVIDAPRRLLQFAVRDAVRTVQPVTPRSESASKRLRSVVSTLASDSALDITHIRLQKTNSDVRIPALRAAAEAAEDAIKGSFSGSVFNRLGRMPTINHTDALREQDPEGEEYENIDNIRAENQVEFYERNQYGGSDAYMHDQESEEATGSAPNIDEYERYNGLGSRQSRLSSSAGKESLVLGYVRGAVEVRGRRLMAQGTHAGSGPSPSGKNLNMSANTSMRKLPTHQTRDAVVSDPQVPMEKKVADARNSNVKITHVNDTVMTDKSKDFIHSGSMLEAQKASSLAAGSNTTGQPEGGPDSRTVFVNNVHFGASKDALTRHFNKFGAVLKTLLVSDGITGQPTGSAYIEFLHKESAERALTLNGTSFMSRILKVVRKSSTEATQLSGLPRASRGSPFASRLIRTAYPRPTFPGAIRGRLPLRGGARSFQWKRGAADSTDAGKPSQTAPAAPGNQLVTPITRSFTYTRTEPKSNDGAMA
ncbi:hypothetical protein SEVIR_7G142300v4 [Setaria viridis]|uniref:RRM domain-containing protein n=1 Tax=Setaria viridis TaxID=4556 RepID=A0A4U6U451_SETVI|nr:uncharacterized protein LOC117864028 [Setaria viridis]TKW04927.1 hypothetical protein SEVIR_7G142300v2 [Setaria viridis]